MTIYPDGMDRGLKILTLDPDPAGSGDAPFRLDARHSQADLQGLPLQTLLLLEAGIKRTRGAQATRMCCSASQRGP